MQLKLPELSLVVLIGASGSGKSSFARKWFKPSEIVSSDFCRYLISNDEGSMDASADAFDLLHFLVAKRLKRGLLTVVDATNVRPEDRKRLVQLARDAHALPAAIILNLPDGVLIDRTKARPDRDLSPRVILNHIGQLRRGLGKIKMEGFRKVYEFRKPEEVDAVTEIVREKLWNDKRGETGPFDIIGDVHGCYEELCKLLEAMGYNIDAGAHMVAAPEGRKLVFLGDLVDRGPDSPSVLRLVMNAVASGVAHCVPGNHDVKLLKWLQGKNVKIAHGLERTIDQIEALADKQDFKPALMKFLDSLVSHYVLDDGKLIVAHAGLKEAMHGRASSAIREFCLFGETTGEIDEFGLPVRYNWASEYKGKAIVVYGHTPVPDVQWLNNTVDIDTGCVFGGRLSALRYPEQELVSVPTAEVYCEPVRPFPAAPTTEEDDSSAPAMSLQQLHDEVLNISDFQGKLIIDTPLVPNITIHEGNGRAALEAISRFAVHPKWLIYLPSTMSPCETSPLPQYLEHPAEAFHYYRKQGVTEVICEEKHMGSRAVVIVCKEERVVQERFGIEEQGSIGICYTRTGRRFFNDRVEELAFLRLLQAELNEKGAWDALQTDWICLDAELMPWSAKAQALLQGQYAAVGTAATHATAAAVEALRACAVRGPEGTDALIEAYEYRHAASAKFVQAYRQYCWPVQDIRDYKLAPFHILATEGRTYFDRDHKWHMDTIASWCGVGLLLATPYRIISLVDEAAVADATTWWEGMVSGGKEGMVLKPLSFIVKTPKGQLVQPAIKVRGPEYLRIIYGLEYDLQQHLKRLKSRKLNTKRSLAVRETSLGIKALESFVQRKPLRIAHQCVFGILALESEPVDPRL